MFLTTPPCHSPGWEHLPLVLSPLNEAEVMCKWISGLADGLSLLSMYVSAEIPPTEIYGSGSLEPAVPYSNNRVCELPTCFLDVVLSQHVPSCLHRGPVHSRGQTDLAWLAHCQVRKSTDCSWGSVGFHPDSDKVAGRLRRRPAQE